MGFDDAGVHIDGGAGRQRALPHGLHRTEQQVRERLQAGALRADLCFAAHRQERSVFIAKWPTVCGLVATAQEVLGQGRARGIEAEQTAVAVVGAQRVQTAHMVTTGASERDEAQQMSPHGRDRLVAQHVTQWPQGLGRQHSNGRFDGQGQPGVGGDGFRPCDEFDLERE